MGIAMALHVLAATVWVGGMFFAHQALRPAALELEPPLRLPLWIRTFGRFFPWVWAAVLILPLTGYGAIFHVYGGFGSVGIHVHIMQVIGIAMILIFLHVFFAPYKRLKRQVAAGDMAGGAAELAKIRRLVGVNLTLGLITIAVAAGGRFF